MSKKILMIIAGVAIVAYKALHTKVGECSQEREIRINND